jgi:hypothetical protein
VSRQMIDREIASIPEFHDLSGRFRKKEKKRN